MPSAPLIKQQAAVLERFRFDQQQLSHSESGLRYLIGTDEVGRGSLIGPVVAAACCFVELSSASQQYLETWAADLPFLRDSKTLTADKRETLRLKLEQVAVSTVALATQHEVEQLNIHHASQLACQRAIEAVIMKLGLTPDKAVEQVLVLIDGKQALKPWPGHQVPVIQGDNTSASIAGAAIIAKQWRDNWVIQQARQAPHYGWATNMGYPTPPHKQAIQQHGPHPLHRKTYKL